MIVYVFLIQRQQDREPWPVVYRDLALAEKAFGRVSPVMPLDVPMLCDWEAQTCATPRVHIESPECWCKPTLDYRDPKTGRELWVHHESN